LEGPDHSASLEPEELKRLVLQIRAIETALGTGVKECSDVELANKMVARKSIVAARDISPGEVISSDMIAIKRPGTGIAPKFLSKVIGCKSLTFIKADQPIDWPMVRKEPVQ